MPFIYIHTIYQKFEGFINFITVWFIAVLSAYIKPVAAIMFIPVKLILLQLVSLDIIKLIETYWHVFTVIAVAVLTVFTIVKTRKETKKTEIEIKLKEKELQHFDLDHKFSELTIDIMAAEERLATYKKAEEKLKKISINEFAELVTNYDNDKNNKSTN